MKTVTRAGVFETNSSSTHSICIAKDKALILDKLPLDEEGVCRVYPGEFGWEEREYNDAATKASYCLTHVKSRPNYGLGTGSDEEMLLSAVIAQGTDAKQVLFVPQGQDYEGKDDWGYIDHQSIENDGGAGEPAFASGEILFNFIFNPASSLITDNDNH